MQKYISNLKSSQSKINKDICNLNQGIKKSALSRWTAVGSKKSSDSVRKLAWGRAGVSLFVSEWHWCGGECVGCTEEKHPEVCAAENKTLA